ncbi:MAG: DUF429 domain-containing protein [Myxococcales bacterium]
MTQPWTIVGVDCATQEERTGLSHGLLDDAGELTVLRVTLGTAGESAAATIAGWLEDADRYLIAMDAPLGWPAPLADALQGHRAGDPLPGESDRLFRRATDRFVQKQLRKVPLEVGADRIARTARAALELLSEVRGLSGRELSMAWEPGADSGVLEVYPAATLLSRGIRASGYKTQNKNGREARAEMFERLSEHLVTSTTRELVMENDDLLDAMICVLAGADFARGEALPPEDLEQARREGWIWFRGRGQRTLF